MENYPLSSIPSAARSKWLSLTMVWAGFVLAISNYLTGSLVAGGLNLSRSFMAIVHGNVLLFVGALFMGLIAQDTGLSTAFSSRYAFGVRGSKFVSGLISLSFIGWGAIGIGLAAESLSHAISLSDGWLVLVMTILFGLTAIRGFKGMLQISSVAIPLILFISFFGLYQVLQDRNIHMSMLLLIEPSEARGFGATVSIVVGSWIAGAISSPDILRYALRKRDVFISLLLALVIINSIQMGIGAVMGTAVGSSDLPHILGHLGFGAFGILLLVFMAWTTADNNFYAAGLGLTNFMNNRNRMLATVVSVMLAGVLALLGFYHYLGEFLSSISLIFAPVGGIIIADFYLNKVGQINHDLFYQGVRWKAMISLMLGIALGIWIPFPMPFFISFVGAALLYTIIILLTRKERIA